MMVSMKSSNAPARLRAANRFWSLAPNNPSRNSSATCRAIRPTRARLLRREVAPSLPFLLQLFMKLRENLVLETALLARVGFEKLSFLRPQAEVNEKFERAGGELFQRADRGAQRRAKKLFRQRGRKRIGRRVGRQRARVQAM